MKLRNKKTGEIWDIGKVLTNDYPCWETLTQVCEDWEDVKEPLIKDEKIRKAVRAWADFNGAYPIYCEDNCTLSYNHAPRIEFLDLVFADLDDRPYTIAELCGEKEEE